MLSICHALTGTGTRKVATAGAAALLSLSSSLSNAWAHSYPQTMVPPPNARLDGPPSDIGITYDSNVLASGTTLQLLDSTGNTVATQPDPPAGPRQSSTAPMADLTPGPYTVDWTSVSADDGHMAQGFYTFVVNGGPVGIIDGQAQGQAPAADLMVSLTVTTAPDGSSLLRADLNNSTGVERVRIQLTGPGLGTNLPADTQPSGDGGWILNNNEVAIPGAWHAQVVVRRTGVVDDAKAEFDFSIDSMTGVPAFASADASTGA
jgi:methionine-rich copper-binding protein CopC